MNMMPGPIRTVVFPVAGLGTRFLPATKAVPKEMLPVVDRPLIQWAVEEAAAAGCREFIFVTAPSKSSIMAHFSSAPHYEEALIAKNKSAELRSLQAGLPEDAVIHEVFQDQPLGLGHAIGCARPFISDQPFAVILPDDMVLSQPGCLAQMVAQYQNCGGHLVAVENVPADKTHQYGIVDPTADDGHLVSIGGLVEKPAAHVAPSTLAIIGRYIFDPRILDAIDRQASGAGGEIQITDAMAQTLGDIPLFGLRFAGQRYDCGNRAGFLAANLAYALAREGADMGDSLAASLDANLSAALMGMLETYQKR